MQLFYVIVFLACIGTAILGMRLLINSFKFSKKNIKRTKTQAEFLNNKKNLEKKLLVSQKDLEKFDRHIQEDRLKKNEKQKEEEVNKHKIEEIRIQKKFKEIKNEELNILVTQLTSKETSVIYNSNEWKIKRNEILKRDYYTCQNCQEFNPGLGLVQILDKKNGCIETHEYFNHPDPKQAIYTFKQSSSGMSFDINFNDCWPVFPIMQVHHKKYIEGKKIWEYENEDLITLCKKCHNNLHINHNIPIYSANNTLLGEIKYTSLDSGLGQKYKHEFSEWTFIKIDSNGEYVISSINPNVTMIVFEGEDKNEIYKEAQIAVDELIDKYFPLYSNNNK